jgi:hypothetical protein
MTTNEWMDQLGWMIDAWIGAGGDRKKRLFKCACCRAVWHLFAEAPSRQAVDVAERFADGLATREELEKASEAADRAWSERRVRPSSDRGISPAHHALSCAARACNLLISFNSTFDTACAAEPAWEGEAGREYILNLARCIFGIAFLRWFPDPRWLTTTVVDLAAAIYEERSFVNLPILADALMDAGCDSAEVLDHCRSEGPHARGCWVVDAILGKA